MGAAGRAAPSARGPAAPGGHAGGGRESEASGGLDGT